MAQVKVVNRSFAGGEISDTMMGRMDDVRYQTGLVKCENFVVLPQGAVENRAGFEYVAKTKDSTKKCRLLPFTFSTDQTFVMEFGEKYIRFHTQGKTVVGDNGQPYEVVTPYLEADLFRLQIAQSADIVTIVCQGYEPKELKRYSTTDWRLDPVVLNTKLTPPKNVSAIRETVGENDPNKDKYKFRYKVSALNKDKTEESEASEKTEVVANLYASGTTVKISWQAVEGAYYYRVYRDVGGVYGYIGETNELSIIDDKITPKTDTTPRIFTDPFSVTKGIKSVQVLTQGSGYPDGSVKSAKIYLETPYHFDYPRNILVPGTWDMVARVSDSGDDGCGSRVRPNVRETKNSAYLIIKSPIGKDAKLKMGIGTQFYKRGYYGSLWSYLTGPYEVLEGGAGFAYNNLGYNCTVYGNGSYVTGSVRGRCQGYSSSGTNTYNGTYPVKLTELKIQDPPKLEVVDPTGSGAELSAVVVEGKITEVVVIHPGKNYTNPTVKVISSSGSGATFEVEVDESTDYPGAVGYYEQRRVFGGSHDKPQTVWMTRTGTENDMSKSFPLRDDDSIEFTISALDFNEVRHIVPVQQLIMFTSAAEWRVTPLNNDALTPTSVSLRPQSQIGCSWVRPVVANNRALFVSAEGSRLYESGYVYQAGGYEASDLCIRSTHLFDNYEIIDMAYSKSPVKIVWACSTSGYLLGLTYLPEQEVYGWHKHKTKGTFESVCTVSEGKEYAVYCVINRTINGEQVRFIERMHTRKFTKLRDAFFVDCGGVYSGDPTTEVSGLTWLEGEEVSILGDGAVFPPQTVKEGKITLDHPCSKVIVGLPYASTMTTPPAIILRTTSAGVGYNKNVNKAWVNVYRTSGLWVGPDEDSLVEKKQRKTEPMGTPPNMMTGQEEIQLKGDWDYKGSVTIRQQDPLPITVLSVGCAVSVGE